MGGAIIAQDGLSGYQLFNINGTIPTLTSLTMQHLDSEVDVREKPVEAVAKGFLQAAGLL